MRKDILEKREELLNWISEGRSKYYICQQLKCQRSTLNTYLEKLGIEYKGQQNKKGQAKGNHYRESSYYMENGLPIGSHRLKIKLIKEGIKDNRCELCGAQYWQGVPLPLELHHKDGDHFNNTLDNLQILCPNCHSIQEGNCGASKGKYSNK